jgi:hypothetical protein
MAYLIKKPRSPFWHLRYRDLDTGAWCTKSTHKRYDDTKDSRAAQRMADEATSREEKVGPDTEGRFDKWVPAYLRRRYANRATWKRCDSAWQRIHEWLKSRDLRHPSQIKYAHLDEYMEWRTTTPTYKHGRRSRRQRRDGELGPRIECPPACRNTARMEVKFFSTMLSEAQHRWEIANPWASVRVEPGAVKKKPDLPPEMLKAARAAFAGHAPWMRTVFEIMAHIGCRFSEAIMPMSRVDFEQKIIYIADAKRKDTDPRKLYAVPLPDTLAAYLKTITDERTAPAANVGSMNCTFNTLLKKATGATSHSLRVSFISRCHRAGLSESQAMRLVNHSTKAVHAIYSRLSLDDARAAMQRVEPPPLAI